MTYLHLSKEKNKIHFLGRAKPNITCVISTEIECIYVFHNVIVLFI